MASRVYKSWRSNCLIFIRLQKSWEFAVLSCAARSRLLGVEWTRSAWFLKSRAPIQFGVRSADIARVEFGRGLYLALPVRFQRQPRYASDQKSGYIAPHH